MQRPEAQGLGRGRVLVAVLSPHHQAQDWTQAWCWLRARCLACPCLPRVTRPLAQGCSGWRWVRARFHPSVNQQPRALGRETTDGVCPDGADPGHPPHPQAAPSAATRCHGELGAASLCPSLLHTRCASGDHHFPPWGALLPPGSLQACRKPPSVEAQFRWAPSADTGACQGGALGPSAAWPTPNPSHLPVHGEVPACHKHTHHEATA